MSTAQISQALDAEETRTNLIINHLPARLTDDEFAKIFSVAGNIKNCRIMKNLKTGESFGFGFVEYDRPEDAAKAILKMNNLQVQHKRIKVSYAQPPTGEDMKVISENLNDKDTNLYIQNVPRAYTLEQLHKIFAPFGNIVQKLIMKDKMTGMPRGVGFVRYEKKSEADAAIAGMNGVVPEGGTEALIVRLAEDKSKRNANQYGFQGGRGRGNYNNRGGGGGYQGRWNMNMNRQPFQQGGKMAPDRPGNRYNPIGSGGGYGGGYGGGGHLPLYSFSTPSFSGGNYT